MDRIDPFVSVLPGRIRLRHPWLRQPARRADLVARLAGLADVECNAATGSLLLRYDRLATDAEAAIRRQVAAVLPWPGPASPDGNPSSAPRKALKWQLNQAAKLGAVASMGVCLAALGRSRTLHARAGLVFLLLMGAHMTVHWRRIAK